jgi:murein DD-endopeptidase MepM/ murein hydrolase activator NlpD
MTYTGATFPIDKVRITLSFASTEKPYNASKPHRGVDLAPFAGSTGQPVYMPWRGKIIGKGYHETAGNYLMAEVSFPFVTWADDLNKKTRTIQANEKITVLFYHFKDMYAKTGDIIKEGISIGTIGNTGTFSFGAHLHLEVRLSSGDVVNPIHLLTATIVGLKEQILSA